MARVRAQIGHVVSQAGAIDVTAYQGRVTLSGSIAAHEVENSCRPWPRSPASLQWTIAWKLTMLQRPPQAGGTMPRAQKIAGVSAFRRSSPAVAGHPL